jgi:hypothetical protein
MKRLFLFFVLFSGISCFRFYSAQEKKGVVDIELGQAVLGGILSQAIKAVDPSLGVAVSIFPKGGLLYRFSLKTSDLEFDSVRDGALFEMEGFRRTLAAEGVEEISFDLGMRLAVTGDSEKNIYLNVKLLPSSIRVRTRQNSPKDFSALFNNIASFIKLKVPLFLEGVSNKYFSPGEQPAGLQFAAGFVPRRKMALGKLLTAYVNDLPRDNFFVLVVNMGLVNELNPIRFQSFESQKEKLILKGITCSD